MGFQNVYRFNSQNRKLIKSVTTGSVDIADAGTSVTAAISVTKNLSFLTFTQKDNVPNAGAEDNLVVGEITNGTTLTFTRRFAASPGFVRIEYSVVEFNIGFGCNVEHSTNSYTLATNNVTISSVPLANAFPIISFNNPGGGNNAKETATAEITSATNLQIIFGAASAQNLNYQIVTCPLWSARVETGTVNTGVTSSDITLSPAVVLSDTFMMLSGRNDSVFDGDSILFNHFVNTTTIRQERKLSAGNWVQKVYVVEGNQTFISQHHDVVVASASTTTNTTLSPAVTVNNSIAITNATLHSWNLNNTNGDESGDTIYLNSSISTTTNVINTRIAAAAVEIKSSISVLDFTKSI